MNLEKFSDVLGAFEPSYWSSVTLGLPQDLSDRALLALGLLSLFWGLALLLARWWSSSTWSLGWQWWRLARKIALANDCKPEQQRQLAAKLVAWLRLRGCVVVTDIARRDGALNTLDRLRYVSGNLDLQAVAQLWWAWRPRRGPMAWLANRSSLKTHS